jgi:hypothetical protein
VYLASALFAQVCYLLATKVWSAVPRVPVGTVFLVWVVILYGSLRGLYALRSRALVWSVAVAAGLTVLAWGFWRGTA